MFKAARRSGLSAIRPTITTTTAFLTVTPIVPMLTRAMLAALDADDSPTSPVSTAASSPTVTSHSSSIASIAASVTSRAVARGVAPPRPIIVWDTETTGLSAAKNHIVEIALEEFGRRADAPVYHFASLVHPVGVSMPRAATRVHGITNAMMRDSPTFAQVWPDLAEYVRDVSASRGRPILLAHNLGFDLRFLREELARIGEPLPKWDFACSLRDVAHILWPGQPASLAALAARFGVVNEEAHRALCDVRATATVLHKADEWLTVQHKETSKGFAITTPVTHGARIRAMLDEAAKQRREVIHGKEIAALMETEDARVEKSLHSATAFSPLPASQESHMEETLEDVTDEEAEDEEMGDAESDEEDSEIRYHYVSGSGIFHNSRSCKRLESSSTIYSEERAPAGRRLCRLCADRWREQSPEDVPESSVSADACTISTPATASASTEEQDEPSSKDVTMNTAMDTAITDMAMRTGPVRSDKNESWFIAPTGRLYHRSRACTNLDLARTIHRVDSVPEHRYACSLCVGK